MIRRQTERIVTLDVDTGVRIPKRYAAKPTVFRPRTIREVLVQADTGLVQYEVKVSGPVVTKTGADSQASAGSVVFADHRLLDGQPLSDLPEPLRAYLVGPQALAGADLPAPGPQ